MWSERERKRERERGKKEEGREGSRRGVQEVGRARRRKGRREYHVSFYFHRIRTTVQIITHHRFIQLSVDVSLNVCLTRC